MAEKFDGRVALVTGGASGIGRIAARFFAREGAKVVVATDKNIKGGEETVKLIRDAGGEAAFVKCDVSSASDVQAMVDKCVSLYGRLDYAYNNAGIGVGHKNVPCVNLVDCPEEVWEGVMDVNLKGVFLCMKYEIKQMLQQKYGVIVNTASICALKPVPGFGAYNVSKSGVVMLTRSTALELATTGIRVNTVAPGPTQGTVMFEELIGSIAGEKEKMLRVIPMKRLGRPEDVAEAVIWLCSDAASFITGHVLPVDGGLNTQ